MTYEYKCQGKCGKVKEKRHGMNEKPTYTCCNTPMTRWYGTAPAGIHGANSGKRSGT